MVYLLVFVIFVKMTIFAGPQKPAVGRKNDKKPDVDVLLPGISIEQLGVNNLTFFGKSLSGA